MYRETVSGNARYEAFTNPNLTESIDINNKTGKLLVNKIINMIETEGGMLKYIVKAAKSRPDAMGAIV